jgi:hypothetical protein
MTESTKPELNPSPDPPSTPLSIPLDEYPPTQEISSILPTPPDPDFVAFIEMESNQPYYDFVKTTFAYTHDIDFNQICVDHDLCHVAIGVGFEYMEYINELQELNYHKNIWYVMTIHLKTDSPIHVQTHPHADPLTEEQLHKLEKLTNTVHKEIGDMIYYCYMAANLVGMYLPMDPEPICHLRAIEHFGDAIKKKVFYKHVVDLKPIVMALHQTLAYLAKENGKSIHYFINQNRAKLMKRYPQGTFKSSDAAEKKDEHA